MLYRPLFKSIDKGAKMFIRFILLWKRLFFCYNTNEKGAIEYCVKGCPPRADQIYDALMRLRSTQ